MKRFRLLFIFLFQAGFLFAQLNPQALLRSAVDSSVTLASFYNPVNQRAEELLTELNASPQPVTYRFTRQFIDAKGIVHEHYQQYYSDLRVRNANYAVHKKGGGIYMLNGRYARLTTTYLLFVVTEASAKAAALDFISTDAGSVKSQVNITGVERVVSANDFNTKDVYQSAYAIATSHPLYSIVYISGLTGKALGYDSKICTVNAPATGDTRYSGTQAFVSDQINVPGGSTFRLREDRNGVSVAVLNMAGQANWENVGAATDFFDADNNWTVAEHGNDNVAVEVKWAMGHDLDYWRIEHNRNSYNGSGGAVNCYVHTTFPVQIGQNNAVWERDSRTMHFVDGAGWQPHTSLDVCSHEFGHGVCQFTSGLVGGSAESGALNEGFSDIWGAAVEAWAAPGKPRWLIGEEPYFPFTLRDMENPNNSLMPGPDTYLQTNWSGTGAPHRNSQILSHWFFLLAEGRSGTNDLGNAFNVTGLGINTAAQIAYLTEQALSSGADYAAAREVSIQESSREFGPCSNEVEQVTRAWYAVGVGGDWVAPTVSNPSLSSNYHIAHTNAAVRFRANWDQATLLNPIEIRWYNANTNLLIGVTPGWNHFFDVNPYCPTRNSTDCIAVYADIVGHCNTIRTPVAGGQFVCSTKTWNNAIVCSFARTVNNGSVSVFPNPASGTATVSLPDGYSIQEIKVLDKLGVVKNHRRFGKGQPKQQVSFAGLRPDTYYVQVYDGTDWKSVVVLVQ